MVCLVSAVALVGCGQTGPTDPPTERPPTSVVSPTASRSPVPPAAIRITSLADDAKVKTAQTVDGTARSVPSGLRLWAVVQPEQSPKFHPQPGPIDIVADGTWSTVCTFGEPAHIGLRFLLIVVLADTEATKQFNEYLREAKSTSVYRGLDALPSGAKRFAQVAVVRR